MLEDVGDTVQKWGLLLMKKKSEVILDREAIHGGPRNASPNLSGKHHTSTTMNARDDLGDEGMNKVRPSGHGFLAMLPPCNYEFDIDPKIWSR